MDMPIEFFVKDITAGEKPKVTISINLMPILSSIYLATGKEKAHQIQAIGPEISDLSGDLLFEEMVLKNLYDTRDKYFSGAAADHISNESISKSLAIVLLQNSAIELIKNSVDSFIAHNSLSSPEGSLTEKNLDICFELDVNEVQETIAVSISDNAGGFDKQFVGKMNKKKSREESIQALSKRSSSSKRGKDNLLGGHGLGLRQLEAGLLGMDLHPNGVMTEKLEFDKNTETSLSFDNIIMPSGKKGAKIVVQTPVKEMKRLDIHSDVVHSLAEAPVTKKNRAATELLAKGLDPLGAPQPDDTSPLTSEGTFDTIDNEGPGIDRGSFDTLDSEGSDIDRDSFDTLDSEGETDDDQNSLDAHDLGEKAIQEASQLTKKNYTKVLDELSEKNLNDTKGDEKTKGPAREV
jgi:hypothetical protein